MQQDEIPVHGRREHPVLFGFGALIVVFVLYGLGTMLIVGATSGPMPTISPKLLPFGVGAAQLLLMFVPALLLAGARPGGIAGALRFKRVHISVYIAVTLGVVALNPVLQTYLLVQELYLVPASWLSTYHLYEQRADELYSLLLKSGGIGIAISLLVGAVIPAISEETLFRGLVQGSFERRLRPFLAVLLTSFLFGLLHFQITSVALMMVGAFLGYAAWSSGSVYPSMLGHALFNTIAIVALNSPMNMENSSAAHTPDELMELLPMAGIGLVTVICAVLWLRVVRQSAAERSEREHSATLDGTNHEQ